MQDILRPHHVDDNSNHDGRPSWENRILGASVLTRFTMLGAAIVVLEGVLGSWPVVATAIWGHHAVDTWIHFLYWIKAFFLALAVLQSRWKPYRFAQNHTHGTPGILELCVGATASCELTTWLMLSMIVHALLSSIVLLLVLVLQHEFQSNTQWILSLVFDAVAIVESVCSPLVLLNFGLEPYIRLHPTVFQNPLDDDAPYSTTATAPNPYVPSNRRRYNNNNNNNSNPYFML